MFGKHPPIAMSSTNNGYELLDDTAPPADGATVVVGLSGGVDSSLCAALLRERGVAVTGLFMKNWEEDDDEMCSAAEDLADAQAVADALQIELRTVNFATEYWDRVFERFLAEHRAGRTPNPDVLCNREIKFKEFVQHASTLGAAIVATGHYVRRARRGNRFLLLRGEDRNKDQSYFLHALDQSALAVARFPVGGLDKREVRARASAFGLATHDKRDSTGICFIGERPFREFLERYIEREPGAILSPDGTRVGTHRGLPFYTIGQRKGLGIGGINGASAQAWYVYDKNLRDNTLHVVQGGDHALLHSDGLQACEVNWISGFAPDASFEASVKTRYRQEDVPCVVHPLGADRMEIWFREPVRAVTPGQSAVVYIGEECLGGGVITQALHAAEAERACG